LEALGLEYKPPIIITNTYETFDNDKDFYNFSFLGRFFNKIAESVTPLSKYDFKTFGKVLTYDNFILNDYLDKPIDQIILGIQEYNKLYNFYNKSENPFCSTLFSELNKNNIVGTLRETMQLYLSINNKEKNKWVKNNQENWFKNYKSFIDTILTLLEAEYTKFFDYATTLFNVNPEILNKSTYYETFFGINNNIRTSSLEPPDKNKLLYSYFCMEDDANYWKINQIQDNDIIDSFKLHGKNLYFISLITEPEKEYYSLLEEFLNCLPMFRINDSIQCKSKDVHDVSPENEKYYNIYSIDLTINSISVSLFKISETLSTPILTFPETTYTCTSKIGNEPEKEIECRQTKLLAIMTPDEKTNNLNNSWTKYLNEKQKNPES
jgi:hypothetical protein